LLDVKTFSERDLEISSGNTFACEAKDRVIACKE
jgi:hypothetical protein